MTKKKTQSSNNNENVSLDDFVEELQEAAPVKETNDKEKSTKDNVSKRNVKPVFHYRNILYTPNGLISPGISPRTLLDARRTCLDVMEATHGIQGTTDNLYEAYQRFTMKRREEKFKSRNEFVTALEKLVELGIFQKFQT